MNRAWFNFSRFIKAVKSKNSALGNKMLKKIKTLVKSRILKNSRTSNKLRTQAVSSLKKSLTLVDSSHSNKLGFFLGICYLACWEHLTILCLPKASSKAFWSMLRANLATFKMRLLVWYIYGHYNHSQRFTRKKEAKERLSGCSIPSQRLISTISI